jgi:uncharacterized protein (TIRG00374 family)
MSTLRNVLYVAALGIALYLLVPRLPGLERSVNILARTSEPLLLAALVAEVLSLACYSEVLGRSVVAASRMRPSLRSRRRGGLGPWFVFRLAVTGHEAGLLVPGGVILQVGIILDELRRRNLKAEDIGVALAVGYLLVYGILGLLCGASLVYLMFQRDVAPMVSAAVFALFAFLAGLVLVARAAHGRSFHAEFRLGELIYLAQRLLRRGWSREAAYDRAKRLLTALRKEFRAAWRVLIGHPLRSAGLVALAFGYWLFDALCLLLILSALGVGIGPGELLVAYAVAQVVAALPFMPLGGLGVAEGALVSMLALLGLSPATTVIPVLGYRLFNYWMPIVLAAIFYPTLSLGAKKARARKAL